MYQILIADDEAEIRNGLCNFFPWKSVGFQLAGQAKNGQEAYEILKHRQVDILLCDIKMPVLSGLDLAKRLYEEKNPTQIIFMSAFNDFLFAKQAMEYGVRSYILKSIHYDDLIVTLSKIRQELDASRQPVPGPSLTYCEKIVATIKCHVAEHYATATLEDITAKLHMSTDYISKFFKRYAGVNFSEYLLKVRMEKARELLRDITYKTYEVSDLVGYSNQFNFSRAFKNYYGKSPREFRFDHLSDR
jgi:YesN/AraC family two-component response regulator